MENWWGEYYRQAANIRARDEARAVRQAELDAADAFRQNYYDHRRGIIAHRDQAIAVLNQLNATR